MATVQIKRKRGQDPLEALMIRNDKLKDNLIFKLAGTFDSAIPDGDQNITLQETSETRVFKRRKADKPKASKAEKGPEEPELPPQLQEMVSEYIQTDIDPETEDYVYDIYFGSKRGTELDSSAVGYIVLDEEDKLVFAHDESESDKYTDDEDSNAEDFYQNDYPEEDDSLGEFDEIDELADFDDLHISDHWSEASD